MNGIGRLVRRAFSEQGLHSVEARRRFVSCASSTTPFRPHDSTSPFLNLPFGKCGQPRGLKSLCKFKGKSAGRNSSGRITVFHRGGGAKRLQRRIDLKRSTASMGVVERVEYDPNRSARIALVRWTGEMQLPRLIKRDKPDKISSPPRKSIDLSGIAVRGMFSYSMMPGIRKSDGDYRRRKTYPKDVFSSALSATGEAPHPLPLPRMAIAGAGPAFVALRAVRRGGDGALSVCEVRKCVPSDSVLWAHRIKRKEAISWQSFRKQETLGLVTAKETVSRRVGKS